MNSIFSLLVALFLCVACQSCSKSGESGDDGNDIPSGNSTPAELWETEWLPTKFAVWNNYRVYHNGELYNPETRVWYSGGTDAGDLDPDASGGIYFGNKRFLSTIVSSTSSGGGCRVNNAFYTEGVPEFVGSKVVFHPALKRGISRSVCSPGGNYDKDFAAETETFAYTISIETDPDGYEYYTLTLTDAKHQSATFYRRK